MSLLLPDGGPQRNPPLYIYKARFTHDESVPASQINISCVVFLTKNIMPMFRGHGSFTPCFSWLVA